MPKWLRASEHALFNLDYIITVRRNADGTAALVIALVPDGVVTETEWNYDALVTALRAARE